MRPGRPFAVISDPTPRTRSRAGAGLVMAEPHTGRLADRDAHPAARLVTAFT